MKLCLADALIKLMKTQDFDTINVNSICREADIGRTTFYRYFENKNSKEEILLFKIKYEWEQYSDRHENDGQGKKPDLTEFIMIAGSCFRYSIRIISFLSLCVRLRI